MLGSIHTSTERISEHMQESTVKDLYPEQNKMRPMVSPSLPASLFLSDRGEVSVLFEAVTFSSLISVFWFILRHSQLP